MIIIKTITKVFQKSIIVSHFNTYPIEKELKGSIQNVVLKPTPKTTTHAWDINPKQSQKYLIFLHGTAQNISCNQSLYKKIISSTDFGILVPEYRGFGNNPDAIISKKTLSQDMNSAFNYLIQKGIKPQNIYSAGHSFGTYPAAQIATKNKISKLILISPIECALTGMKNYAKKLRINMINKKAFFLCENSRIIERYFESFFNITKFTKKCETPIDIIHSKGDSLIENGKFYKIAKTCKNLHNVRVLSEGTHKLDEPKIDELVKILKEEFYG